MEPIYNVKQNLETVKRRLKNLALPENVKDKIFEFVDVLREGSGSTDSTTILKGLSLSAGCWVRGYRILQNRM